MCKLIRRSEQRPSGVSTDVLIPGRIRGRDGHENMRFLCFGSKMMERTKATSILLAHLARLVDVPKGIFSEYMSMPAVQAVGYSRMTIRFEGVVAA